MRRILAYALKRLVRSPGLALSTVGVLALIAFFVNVLLAANWFVGGFVTSVVERLPLTVYLKSEYSRPSDEVFAFLSDLKAVDTSVKAEYVSPQEALKRQRERFPDLVAILESGDENPLPASMVVSIPNLELYDQVNAVVLSHSGLALSSPDRTLADYKLQFAKIRQAVRVMSLVQAGILSLVVLFALALVAILYAAVGNSVFFWQDEIRVARLVGGSPWFIHGPFAAQGAALAALGGAVGIGLFAATLSFLGRTEVFNFQMRAADMTYALAQYVPEHAWALGVQWLALAALGTLAAMAASRGFTSRT